MGTGSECGAEVPSTVASLERVRKQVDFYFSDANLRQDTFLRRKLHDGLPLTTLLQFGRLRAMRVQLHQLLEAIHGSDMLKLSDDRTLVMRDLVRFPVEEVDVTSRTIYAEGLPITFDVDDLCKFFARQGHVRLVQLPRHRETQEARGFCFVEFAEQREAEAAVLALDGHWPVEWPTRYDGRALRVMSKQRWLEYKAEYNALQRSVRRPDSTEKSLKSTLDASCVQSAISEATATGGMQTRARGCLLRVSGFSEPQTRTSVRQFAEHAVVVEYCDFNPGDSVAYLRVKCPDDCAVLLEDLRLSRRMLGWLIPEVRVLDPDEEDRYREARQRPRSERPPAKKVRRKCMHLRDSVENPHGIVCLGPAKSTTLHRTGEGDVRVEGSDETLRRGLGSCTDIVGSQGGSQAGFGRRVRKGPRQRRTARHRSGSRPASPGSLVKRPEPAEVNRPSSPGVRPRRRALSDAGKTPQVVPRTSDSRCLPPPSPKPDILDARNMPPPSPAPGAKPKRKAQTSLLPPPRSPAAFRLPPESPIAERASPEVCREPTEGDALNSMLQNTCDILDLADLGIP